MASSIIPRTARPSLSRVVRKYRAYGVSWPFSHTTRVGNRSSTAPSHTSRAECEPIVASRMADGSYVSRTFRIASRPTIVPVPSRCGPMVPPSLILWERGTRPWRNVFIGRFISSHVGRTTGQMVGVARRRRRDYRPSGPAAGARPARDQEPGDPRDGIAVTEFSARTRAANLERMRNESFDVLVVGGGVVGAGVARDAACRGLATALVDRGDFAGGTSGKTSRLVHGGLRYLRNYRFGLVRRAVRERDLLLRNAPGLVHPLPFLIPAYADPGPSRTLLPFGPFLDDLLSKAKTLPRRSWLSAEEAREREPRIAGRGLAGAGLYYDPWTDDSRLVLAIVQDAAAAGAAVANHVEGQGLVHEGSRVAGARLRDAMAGASFEVSARFVVNATGVWLDRLRTARRGPTIRPTKGIHVFVPRAKIGNRSALALSAKRDGRIVFVLPWGNLALVGTTDTDFRGDPHRVG